jgi:hypothetical protein
LLNHKNQQEKKQVKRRDPKSRQLTFFRKKKRTKPKTHTTIKGGITQARVVSTQSQQLNSSKVKAANFL